MKISHDVLEGIIGHPVGSSDERGESRLSRRVAVSKRATVCHRGSAVEIPITILDVSSGGVGFIYSSPLCPGEQFVLRLTGRDGDGVVVECAVRWHMKTGSGRCRIGSEFIQVMDYDEQLQPSKVGSA